MEDKPHCFRPDTMRLMKDLGLEGNEGVLIEIENNQGGGLYFAAGDNPDHSSFQFIDRYIGEIEAAGYEWESITIARYWPEDGAVKYRTLGGRKKVHELSEQTQWRKMAA